LDALDQKPAGFCTGSKKLGIEPKMAPKQIESIELDNGLTLTLYDASRKVADDHWQVKLEAHIDIPVAAHHFSAKVPPPAPLEQIRAKLGDTVRFTYQATRNFIAPDDKEALFHQMHANVLAKTPYYSHPDFAARFLRQEFARCRYLPDASE
jgi:hypothetical protein